MKLLSLIFTLKVFIFAGARMTYLLDPSKQDEAIKLTTSLEPNISRISLQVCTDTQFLCITRANEKKSENAAVPFLWVV